ncbi:MAG TPA: hypothetical protein VFO40_26740 [Chthoniobacterales bacterium]|nr:hypothetical protein [Chthoniobacterales bacterium]
MNNRLRNTKRGFLGSVVLILAGVITPTLTTHADPITELRSLSVFKNADLAKLAAGDVLASQGPGMRFARGGSAESAYIVRAPVKTVVGLIQQWRPTQHPELRVYLQEDVSARVGSNDFQNLASAPSNSSVKAFVDATEKLPGDASKLQLSSAEVKQYAGGGSPGGGTIPAPVVAFWSQVLAQRAKSFLSGGLAAQPPYQTSGSTILAADEVAHLLEERSNVRSQFSSLISSTAIGGGRGSATPSLTWQLFHGGARGAVSLAAVSLDAFYARPAADGWQTGDLGFYSSGAYYAAVTLHQLWPVQVDGGEATLVWRVDLVSSAPLAELRGAERLGSGAAMMREIQTNVRAFLKDAPRGK